MFFFCLLPQLFLLYSIFVHGASDFIHMCVHMFTMIRPMWGKINSSLWVYTVQEANPHRLLVLQSSIQVSPPPNYQQVAVLRGSRQECPATAYMIILWCFQISNWSTGYHINDKTRIHLKQQYWPSRKQPPTKLWLKKKSLSPLPPHRGHAPVGHSHSERADG